MERNPEWWLVQARTIIGATVAVQSFPDEDEADEFANYLAGRGYVVTILPLYDLLPSLQPLFDDINENGWDD